MSGACTSVMFSTDSATDSLSPRVAFDCRNWRVSILAASSIIFVMSPALSSGIGGVDAARDDQSGSEKRGRGSCVRRLRAIIGAVSFIIERYLLLGLYLAGYTLVGCYVGFHVYFGSEVIFTSVGTWQSVLHAECLPTLAPTYAPAYRGYLLITTFHWAAGGFTLNVFLGHDYIQLPRLELRSIF